MINQGQCSQCKQPNDYTKIICDFCGNRLPWSEAAQKAQPLPVAPPIAPPLPLSAYAPQATPMNDDGPNVGYAVIGFFIPIVGLILYLVENGKHPQKAASAGKGALWGFGLGIVVPFIVIILLSILGNRVKTTYAPAPVPGLVLMKS